jgi:hypothetical protein
VTWAGALVGKNGLDRQAGNGFEVTHVAGDQPQSVLQSRGGDLQIGVGVEEVRDLPEPGRAARPAADDVPYPFDNGVRPRPAAGHGDEASGRPRGTQPLELRQIAR